MKSLQTIKETVARVKRDKDQRQRDKGSTGSRNQKSGAEQAREEMLKRHLEKP